MRFYADGAYYHLTIHQHKPELPYILLLHGFMGTENVFLPLTEKLPPFCNPVTIDLLGHGKTITDPDPDRFRAKKQVADVKSILSRLSYENLYLYGYSMGGRLAFQALVTHPGYFQGAIIESAHCGLISDDEKHQRKNTDEERAVAIESDFTSFLTEWSNLSLFKHTPEEQRKHYKDVMISQDPKLMAASLRGFGSGVVPEVCSKLQDLPVPLHLISGEYDEKYMKIMSTIREKNPHIQHSVIPGAGHRVHVDQAEEVVSVIEGFIDKVSP